ncbi:MAG TPA: hypothetical protein VJB61_18505 [Actinomycetota bacterium]
MVLAVVLGWLWAGGLAASAAGNPTDELTTSHSLLVLDPAVPPGRAPALRPSAERPDPGGRLVPLVLGLVVAALAATVGPGARRPRPGPVPVRSLLWSTHLEARAPPTLQPA